VTWFKVDDGLHSHPKWMAIPPAARGLWVTAGSWASAHLTDGHIPRHALTALGGRPRDAADLVRIGLWEENGDGWRFHEWHTDSDGSRRNPTKHEVDADRAAARDRQRRARDKARESRRDNPRESPSESRREFAPPDPTRPTKDLTSSDGLTTRPDLSDDEDPGQPPPKLPPIVCQAIAILASRDVTHRQAADHLPPLGNPTTWENSAYDRRIAVAWPLAKLAEQHPDWTAEQIADFAEPPPDPAAVSGTRSQKPSPLDDQQAAALAAAERHRRIAAGEGCQDCHDTGFTLDEDGTAVPCTHQETP